MSSIVPDDFESNLLASFQKIKGAQAALSGQQVIYGQKLWAHLNEEDKQRRDIYLVISQGIELLNDLKIENEHDLDFEKGFTLIKNLKTESLLELKKHNEICKIISEEKKVATIGNRIFIDLESILGSHPTVTRASLIGSGGFGTVLKVEQIKDRIFPLFGEYAIKIAEDIKNRRIVLDEYEFLIELHDSQKLTPEEKIDLPLRPTRVTYMQARCFKNESKEGYLMKFYPSTLYDYLNQTPLAMQQKIRIAKELIYKMSLLSKADVFYTDIKATNIMIDPRGSSFRIDFADFGDCYISTQTRKNQFVTTYVMKDDKDFISSCLRNLKSPLQKYVNWHMSRSLALVFVKLFSSKSAKLKNNYTFKELQDCLTSQKPFSELQNADLKLYELINQMLEIEPISPQEAWLKLSN